MTTSDKQGFDVEGLRETSTRQKTARDKDIELIEHLARDAFKDHVINVKHCEGLYRHFDCRNANGSGCYSFQLVTFPGRLIISGDVGDLMLTRCTDMLDWAKSAVGSISYFAEKVVAGKVHVYSGDVAREAIEQAKQDIIDDTEEGEEPDLSKFEAFDGWHDFDNPHETLTAFWESDIWDGGDWPSTDTYASNFLWCRECVKWFFENYKEQPQ